MAKYGKSVGKRVKSAMHRKKRGTLKSGSGRKVQSRKQAIAIGLSEARQKGFRDAASSSIEPDLSRPSLVSDAQAYASRD
jgi:hypothetical protein